MNKRSISLEEYSLEINRRGGRRLDADCRAFPDGNGSSPGKRAFLIFFLPPFHLLFRFLALPHTPSGRIRQRPTVLHRIVHRNAGSDGRTDGGRILSRGGFYISLPSRRRETLSRTSHPTAPPYPPGPRAIRQGAPLPVKRPRPPPAPPRPAPPSRRPARL